MMDQLYDSNVATSVEVVYEEIKQQQEMSLGWPPWSSTKGGSLVTVREGLVIVTTTGSSSSTLGTSLAIEVGTAHSQ